MIRSLLHVSIKDKIRISILKEKLKKLRDFRFEFKRKKWEWAGHISRSTDNRWGYKILNWLPGGKRKPGRQKTRWKDDLTYFTGTYHFSRIAQDRTEWVRLKESFACGLGPADTTDKREILSYN